MRSDLIGSIQSEETERPYSLSTDFDQRINEPENCPRLRIEVPPTAFRTETLTLTLTLTLCNSELRPKSHGAMEVWHTCISTVDLDL